MFKSVVFIASLLLLSQSLAGTPDCIHKSKLKVALYNLGHFYNGNEGLDFDIINEMQKRSKCSFDIKMMPRARIWKELEYGQLNIATSGIQTVERSKFAVFIPYIRQKNYAVIPKDLELRNEADLKKYF